MAEVLHNGLHLDNDRLSQPPGTIRFGVNLIRETEIGERGSLSTEPGNESCFNIPIGYTLIGSINIDQDKLVLFLTNNVTSKIWLFHDCNTHEVVSSDCLGFSTANRINGVFNQTACCRHIYWCDGVNNDRYFDLDNPSDFYSDALIAHLDAGNPIGTFVGEKWNCELFNLIPNFSQPTTDVSIIQGGLLEYGSYWFTYKYVDRSGSTTHFTNLTNRVIVIDDNAGSNPITISGAYNEEFVDNALGGKPKANKSIKLDLSNLDTNYDQIEVYVVKAVTGDGITYSAFKYNTYDIKDNSLTIVYNGNDDFRIDLADIIVPPANYHKSKTMEIIDNRLVRGNVTSKDNDWNEVQRYISNAVQSSQVTTTWRSYNMVSPSTSSGLVGSQPLYRSPEASYNLTTFMRDEVYALGIVFQMKDGTKSPVIHLPGRNVIIDAPTIALGNNNSLTGTIYHPRPVITGANYDKHMLTVVGNIVDPSYDANIHISINDVKHLGFDPNNLDVDDLATCLTDIGYGAGLVPHWLVFNTAIVTSTSENIITGLMGYHECVNTPYPDIKNCNNQSIFPSGNIRHHRIPDNTIDPHMQTDGSQIYRGLSIIIQGIDISAINGLANVSDIVGYYIVKGKRTEDNKTVLDKGILERTLHGVSYLSGAKLNPVDPEEYVVQSYIYNQRIPTGEDLIEFIRAGADNGILDMTGFSNRESEFYSLYASKQFFDESIVQGTYLKLESIVQGSIRWDNTSYLYDDRDTRWWDIVNTNREYWTTHQLNLSTVTSELTSATTRLRTHFLYDSAKYLRSNEIYANGGNPTYRSYGSQDNQIIKLDTDSLIIPSVNPFVFAYVAPSVIVGNGVNRSGTHAYYYVSIKQYLPDAYSNLNTIEYIDTDSVMHTTTSIQILGGDIYIDRLDVRKTYSFGDKKFGIPLNKVAYIAASRISPIGSLFLLRSNVEYVHNTHITFHTESDYNIGLRHEGYALSLDYPQTDEQSTTKNEEMPVANALAFYPKSYQRISDYLEKPVWFPNSFLYNLDYTAIKPISYFSQFDRDYCDSCEYEYPNRVVWSLRYDGESRQNSFRTFLVNNYKDIANHKGPLTAIKNYQSKVFLFTPWSLFITQINPQQIETNASNIYIGTGDFMSLPEQDIIESQTSYGGCEQQEAVIKTPHGLFWADTKSGKVFTYYNGIKELNVLGLNNYLKNNLRLELADYYLKNNGIEYPFKHSLSYWSGSTMGTGCHLYYDPRFDRVLVTLRDFRPIDNPVISTDFIITDDYAFKAFTLSYDIKAQSWTSFHSYTPYVAFNDSRHFYTAMFKNISESGLDINKLWKHVHRGNYCTFYNYYAAFKIEIIQPYVQTVKTNVIKWVSKVFTYDAFTNTYQEVRNLIGIRYLMMYNDNQVGYVPLDNEQVTQGNLYYNPTVVQKDETWKVNATFNIFTPINGAAVDNFYDNINGVPSANLNDFRVYIRNINFGSSNYTANLYEYTPMKGKYIGIIFYTEDTFLLTRSSQKVVFNFIDSVLQNTHQQ